MLLKEAGETGTISIANFYARRVRRILPALAVVITATLLLGFLLLPPFGEKLVLAKSAGAAALFVANHYFLAATSGYFNQQSELFPLLHLWSLAVEEQFYLLWPLLLLTVVKRTTRVRLLISALSAASFIVSFWLLQKNPSAAFFLLPSRAWELGVGCLLATLPSPVSPALRSAFGLLGSALVAISFLFVNGTAWLAAPVIGAALLICDRTRILAWKPLVRIGLLSYSWYLWHWPLLSIVRNRRLTAPSVWINCGIVLIALLCAAISVRYIENPIRHHRGARVSIRPVLLTGAATLLAMLGLAGALGAREKHRPPDPYPGIALKERPPLLADCLVANQTWDGRVFLPKCDEVPPGHDASDNRLAIVWGDSHADAWAPAIRLLAEAGKIEVREISLATCPPVSGATVSTSAGIVPNCGAFNAAVLAALKQPARHIGVVLAARWPGYIGVFPLSIREHAMPFPKFYATRGSTVPENAKALRDGLTRTLAALANLRIRTLVLLGGPEFRIAPVRCAILFGEPACSQPRAEIETWRKPAVDAIRQTAAPFPEARIIDPLPFFCPSDSCPAFINGKVVDYDESHISVSASQSFAPAMREHFRWLFGQN